MPDRIIRDELLDSERWLSLPRNTHRLAFVCLIPKADPLGNMESSDGQLYRLWRDPLKLDARSAVPEILEALVSVDLVRLYTDAEKRYLHIPRFKQRLRYLGRLCPLSPWTTVEEKQRVENNSPGDRLALTRGAPAEVKRSEVEVKRSEEKQTKSKSVRATRLPPDWQLPEDWKTWAIKVFHLEPQKVVRIGLMFRDFWHAKAGANAAKMDWFATWRIWVTKEVERA